MLRGATGSWAPTSAAEGRITRAFVPAPLPPVPSLDIGPEVRDRLDAALLALGRLDSITTLLPDAHLFLYSYIRKEAVLSSQIEGTQSSLSDLLLFEAEELPGAPIDDVVEVSSYVAALELGLQRVRDGLPLSGRLLRELHLTLMQRGRGVERAPGEYRRIQNWVGDRRADVVHHVPPPPGELAKTMGALEEWLNDVPERTPPLIKAALAHVQFETIHPFLDGNGRLGRLLITLSLTVDGVLQEPLLYLSLYLKEHRAEYYELLNRVRADGDWEGWLHFFATGVEETARGSVDTAQRLVRLFRKDADRIKRLGRGSGSPLRVHQAMQGRPINSAARLARETGLSVPTVNTALEALQGLKLVKEVTGKRRGKLYSYQPYLKILNEGTAPLK